MNKKERTELQDEIVQEVVPGSSGLLHLSPRLGKTRIIIQVIKRDKPKSILWVTPSSELAENEIPKEFNKWGAKRFKKDLVTSTWASLSKITGYYDLIILDEVQKITGAHLAVLKRLQSKGQILGMTGTPSSTISKQEIYEELGLKVIYQLLMDEAVEKGVLADYTVNIIKVPLSHKEDVHIKAKTFEFITSEYKQYQYLTKQVEQFKGTIKAKFPILNRMRAIKDSKSKFDVTKNLISKLKGRKLIFCSSINQAEKFSPYTFHSKTDDKNLLAFQEGIIPEVYMVNSGGIGFTFKELDHLIITQINSDKNGDSSQKITRTLLKQPKGYKACIWIILLEGTQDEVWGEQLLKKFNPDKVVVHNNINELT